MTNVAELLAAGARRLVASGVESARLDARVLLAHVLNKQTGEVFGNGAVSNDTVTHFDTLIARRAAREPVAYITGHKEFWSLDFEVGPGVLVPRPETETLVEQTLLEFPDRTAPLEAIDLGTGSGCILLSFLAEYPGAKGIGIERSPAAIVHARRNAARLAPRCELIESDWSLAPAGPFDVVFSNPPYLAQKELALAAPELRTEPEGALVAGADGLDAYRALSPVIAARLKPNGRVFLEIGAAQADAVAAILAAEGLETLRSAPDLSGAPRCIVARPQKTVGMTGPSL
jgi:release factor glutamine methyltransferase